MGPAKASRDKLLGSLPVLAEFCRRLDIRGVVDRACPVRDVAHLTHGQVIEALVANRLTSPQPLMHVEAWAREWAVPEVFGIEPGLLNDDRIGRALDALAPVLEGIVGSVGARAIEEFGIDVSRIHWDMTSISLFGAYDSADGDFARPAFGHPKDRRFDLKQIQAGIGVTGDGGIPVFHRSFDGGAGEVSQVVGAMESLRSMCGPRRFLLVGDSKLISAGNVAAMHAAHVTFIAPASKAYVSAEVLRAANSMVAVDVGYTARRDEAKPADQHGTYKVAEDAWTMPKASGGTGAGVEVRRVFVWSSADAGAAAAARANKLAKATVDLDHLVAGLGGRYSNTTDKVAARVAVIASKRRVGAYLVTTITAGADNKPTLTWSFDQTVIDHEAHTDGWYCLLTNLPAEVGAGDVLVRYKGQEAVERRYHAFKGPLAVAPLFLKNNARIEALLTVICLALLIFCLIEREVRQGIAPEHTMAGFAGRSRARPTGKLILNALARMRLAPATANSPPMIYRPDKLEARLLELLGTKATTIR